MTTLPFDFDIFLRSGSRIQPVIVVSRHGSAPCSNCARTTVANSQVRMISGPCGRRSIGNVRSNRSGSSTQPVGDLRRERRRRPRVHHVGVADETAGLAALVVGEARRARRWTGRSGSVASSGSDRVVVVGVAVGVERVPDRERHAEVALAADEPVAVEALDPGLVADCACTAGASAARVPRVEERVAQLGVAAAVADVPLPRRDDLERAVAASRRTSPGG